MGQAPAKGASAGIRRPRWRAYPGGGSQDPSPPDTNSVSRHPSPRRGGVVRGVAGYRSPPPRFYNGSARMYHPRDWRFVAPGIQCGDKRQTMRLLIIEDDRDAADYLVKAFREVGHMADRAGDGEEGLQLALDGEYDVLIVDRMLPKRDGLSVIGALRAKSIETPVLILSALGQVDDRVKGLRTGGDDYLAKPYAFSELLARVEALARRRGSRGEETVYRVGDLELNRLSHEVSRSGQEVQLQPREFRLLEYLMRHAGQVVTRTMLLENVWDYHFDPQTNVIDVHISRLRSKIDKGFSQPLLHTVRGAGYMIRDGAR
jgi:two-component system, OmpR family, response regulator